MKNWFQLACDTVLAMRGKNIATQELLPVVLAGAVWGKAWTGWHVQCLCDNEAVVAVLIASATAVKMIGADRNPNGRVASKYSWLSHLIPSV